MKVSVIERYSSILCLSVAVNIYWGQCVPCAGTVGTIEELTVVVGQTKLNAHKTAMNDEIGA